MTDRSMLLRRIAALDFAVVELNLYMDTHPFDSDVNDKLNEYKQKSRVLREEFEKKFGPLTSTDKEKNRWGWISDPWPWNNERGEE